MTDERTKTEDVARVDEAPQCCQSCGRNLIATLAWECNDGLRRCTDCQSLCILLRHIELQTTEHEPSKGSSLTSPADPSQE